MRVLGAPVPRGVPSVLPGLGLTSSRVGPGLGLTPSRVGPGLGLTPSRVGVTQVAKQLKEQQMVMRGHRETSMVHELNR